MKNKAIVPSLISAAMLIIAVFPIGEYGYFILLRWIVCLSAAFSAYLAYQSGKEIWMCLIGMVAVLFNPIAPIHLSKSVWSPIDIVAALLFIANIFVLERKNSEKRNK